MLLGAGWDAFLLICVGIPHTNCTVDVDTTRNELKELFTSELYAELLGFLRGYYIRTMPPIYHETKLVSTQVNDTRITRSVENTSLHSSAGSLKSFNLISKAECPTIPTPPPDTSL